MNTKYKKIKPYFKSLLNPSIIVSLMGVLVSLIILIVTIKSNHKESIAVAISLYPLVALSGLMVVITVAKWVNRIITKTKSNE